MQPCQLVSLYPSWMTPSRTWASLSAGWPRRSSVFTKCTTEGGEALDVHWTSCGYFKALSLPGAPTLWSSHSISFKLREKSTSFAALLRRRNIRRKLKVIMQLNIFISKLDYIVLSLLPKAAGDRRRTQTHTRTGYKRTGFCLYCQV